jgi:hypothetical protein
MTDSAAKFTLGRTRQNTDLIDTQRLEVEKLGANHSDFWESVPRAGPAYCLLSTFEQLRLLACGAVWVVRTDVLEEHIEPAVPSYC